MSPGRITCTSQILNGIEGAALANKKFRMSTHTAATTEPTLPSPQARTGSYGALQLHSGEPNVDHMLARYPALRQQTEHMSAVAALALQTTLLCRPEHSHCPTLASPDGPIQDTVL